MGPCCRLLGGILPLLATACVQPLRLMRDDSATMLARQLIAAPNPSTPGAYPVRTLYYGSGTDLRRRAFRDSVTLKTAPVDGSKLVSGPTPEITRSRKKFWGFSFDTLPVNGRVWYPEGDGPFPLVLIVHGNHSMEDFSDPGYGYLGQLLASRGYILVSVDENFLNGSLRGENDARGWMLLQHLKAWRRFNDSAGSPFRGKVDLERIALMGHSRGGEAVAVAGAFNRLSHYPDDATLTFDFHFGIKSLVAIAPVDGQYEPANHPTPLENVNYLIMHGSHDGDVSSFSGHRQWARIRFTDGQPWFKAAVFMYRANHGQWNTVWGSTDGGPGSQRFLDLRGLLPPEEQRRMAEVYISAFLDATLKGKREYLPMFRDHRMAGGWLPKAMYITRFQESGFHGLATYDEDVEVSTGSAPGVTIAAESLATWREGVLPLRSRNPNVGHYAVWLGWNNRIAGKDTTRIGKAASYTVSLGDSLRTAWHVGAGTALEFSLAPTDMVPGPRAASKDSTAAKQPSARQPRPPAPRKGDPAAKDSIPMTLSVEVVDAGGTAVRLPLARYGAIRRPLDATVLKRKGLDKSSFSSLAELVPQTYVIPLADFHAAMPGFDPAHLAAIRWVFDGTTAGTVILTDIGLSNIDPAFLLPEPR